MKKIFFLKRNVVATAICLAASMFTGCNKSAEETPKAITVADGDVLTQEVYADESQGKSGVTFATTGAWTSVISETATSAKSSQVRAAAAPAWISISPASGDKAGSYTIVITFATNYSGADRSAIITISCEGTEIEISVTQKGVKKDGTRPAELTQAEIVALLTESWEKVSNSSEAAIIGEDDKYYKSLEWNRTQKRHLEKNIYKKEGVLNKDAILSFNYVEDFTKYEFDADNNYKKSSATVDADYWDRKPEAELEFEYYIWSVSGKTFTGVGETEYNVLIITLNDNNLFASMTIKDKDGPEDEESVNFTFSYSNVNPVFPEGFSKAEFLTGGSGTFSFTLAEQPFVIDRATQQVRYFSRFQEEGGGGWNSANLNFYSNDAKVELPPLVVNSQAEQLTAGNYTGMIPVWNGTYFELPPVGTFYRGTGDRHYFDGTEYYVVDGAITVTAENGIYTVYVDLDTSSKPNGLGDLGKITGSYTGFLTVTE